VGTEHKLLVASVAVLVALSGVSAGAAEQYPAEVGVDITGPWESTGHRTARIEANLRIPQDEASGRKLALSLADAACGLDESANRVCIPVEVHSVAVAESDLPFRFSGGLLTFFLPVETETAAGIRVSVEYSFPAFARGSGAVGLSGTDGWIPQGFAPPSSVELVVNTIAEERAIAGGNLADEQIVEGTRTAVWEDVDGRRPALVVGPFGPTAPLIEDTATMTLIEGVALEPELTTAVRVAVSFQRAAVGGLPLAPVHLVVTPYKMGDVGAPMVGMPGAFGDRLVVIHSPWPVQAFDVERPDRLFPIPSREVRSTEEMLNAALRAHWSGQVTVSDSPTDAWIRGFVSEALADRSMLSNPWASPAGGLRRDHVALWPDDPQPERPDLEALGRYLAHLVKLRVGDEKFEEGERSVLAVALDEPLNNGTFLSCWQTPEDPLAVVGIFQDVLDARTLSYIEVFWSSQKVGLPGQGGRWDAVIELERHGGHEGDVAVHLALLTTSGEVREMWTLLDADGLRLEVEGLPAQLAEVFVIRDSLAAAVSSSDLVPNQPEVPEPLL